jgi:hypothetical protein
MWFYRQGGFGSIVSDPTNLFEENGTVTLDQFFRIP